MMTQMIYIIHLLFQLFVAICSKTCDDSTLTVMSRLYCLWTIFNLNIEIYLRCYVKTFLHHRFYSSTKWLTICLWVLMMVIITASSVCFMYLSLRYMTYLSCISHCKFCRCHHLGILSSLQLSHWEFHCLIVIVYEILTTFNNAF